MTHPQQEVHHQPVQPPSANVPAYPPSLPADSASSQLPATQPELAPLPALMHPLSSLVCRSSRSNKGVTSKFEDYITGDKFDILNLSTPCSLCHSPVRTQQPAPYYIQSMACNSQLPTPQPSPAQGPFQSYKYQPYQPCNTPCDQYTQQCNPQPMRPVISPAENRVFVTDGFSWIDSWRRMSPPRGTYLGMVVL